MSAPAKADKVKKREEERKEEEIKMKGKEKAKKLVSIPCDRASS